MSEYTNVEKPAIEALQAMGYRYLTAKQIDKLREDEHFVLLRDQVVDAVMRINDVPRVTAESVYGGLVSLKENEKWFERFRGNFSKKVSGESTHSTIRLLDFEHLENNEWVVTRQLRVKGPGGTIKPDIAIYVNGIPLVVLEAKDTNVDVKEGFYQMERYMEQAPRLFASNVFNIATNSRRFRYAATGAPWQFWFHWRDPWPRRESEFKTAMHKGLWATLEPSRLLDLIAHFVVFERDEKSQKVVKKICRYQQFRAVNKMVERVCGGEHRKGLIWHTQGSGKSLTMAFATLKFKFHRGIEHPALKNPNILVVTDRRDLDAQITNTFKACGLPNPKHARSIEKLREYLEQDSPGRTITSTIFKFDQDDRRLNSDSMRERREAMQELAIDDSERWILLIDECHRTQEELLGAYLRATLPDAVYFGFTGTPVKKNDKNTYANFGVPGEKYLDKYGIDQAVKDKATVEVRYTARMSQWHLHDTELDETFERWFAHEPPETVEAIKERGVRKSDLARLETRIAMIAGDMWEHYRTQIMPDGYKAQVVAIDREAVVTYKKALDDAISKWFVEEEGLDEEEARQRAEQMSAPIYSPSQNDQTKHRQIYDFQLSDHEQKEAIKTFRNPEGDLKFLIVCDKLLTGFDAPVEQVMYLDKGLSDHNLLQAIARTNRRFQGKPYGLIVDYYGVTKNLKEALSAYRDEDVRGAMKDEEGLLATLADAHREVMAMVDDEAGRDPVEAVNALGGEDQWYLFRRRAKEFIDLYAALLPNRETIPYEPDVRLLGQMMLWGKDKWEHEQPDLNFKEYSEKIREMLRRHVEVTGIAEICKLRGLDDPMFWDDFNKEPEDLETAAVRKLTELKKVVREKSQQNEQRYEKFSERIKELIESFQLGLFDENEAMERAEELSRDLQREEQAYQSTSLSEEAYGIFRILEESLATVGTAPSEPLTDQSAVYGEALAEAIDALYLSDEDAPSRWQDKSALRKKLRQKVRHILIKEGIDDWKGLPEKIEKFARSHYAKD